MGLPSVPKPRILGADGAGVVEALGAGVDGFASATASSSIRGSSTAHRSPFSESTATGPHCELIAVPAEQVFPLDDALSFEEAAAFPLVYETAYRMLVTKAAVQEGEWVLIWGIGGGVATAAFEICRALGARTIVTSGSDEKLEQARAWGADVAVNHHTGDVVQTVKEATGVGVDVVVETVGEATWARSLGAVAAGGRIGVCGATSGPNPPAALHRFWWKQLTVYGSSMGTRDDFLGAYDLVRSGRARVHVDTRVPARRGPCRARAARGRRAARQDRSFDSVKAGRKPRREAEASLPCAIPSLAASLWPRSSSRRSDLPASARRCGARSFLPEASARHSCAPTPSPRTSFVRALSRARTSRTGRSRPPTSQRERSRPGWHSSSDAQPRI